MSLHRLFCCPCCGFPSLPERNAFEICTICWWEDDGQDDADAGNVRGGPNGRYSLSAARVNFLAHGHMYNLGDGIEIVEHPSSERVLLLAYVRRVLNGEEALDEGKLESMMELRTPEHRLFPS
jgi:hypothetical protein